MTVGELIKKLQKRDKASIVYYTDKFGKHEVTDVKPMLTKNGSVTIIMNGDGGRYEREDEPQIYCDTCGLNKKCGDAFTEEARHCQNESRLLKDEPQTDCPHCGSYECPRNEQDEPQTEPLKQVKYFDEDEKVWKIGSVIVE